ncbi:hypothetical protein ACS0TY_030704 [Phlomoides rotata]
MVRSMMSYSALPKSFYGYALETTAYILNLVPSKSVPKTPPDLWIGRKPSMRDMRIWGCPAYVLDKEANKLEPCSELRLFVGYHRGTKWGLFYSPKDQWIVDIRRSRSFHILRISWRRFSSPPPRHEIFENHFPKYKNKSADFFRKIATKTWPSVVLVQGELKGLPGELKKSSHGELDEIRGELKKLHGELGEMHGELTRVRMESSVRYVESLNSCMESSRRCMESSMRYVESSKSCMESSKVLGTPG